MVSVGPSKSNIAIITHTLSTAHQTLFNQAPTISRLEVVEPCCGDTFAVAVLATSPTVVTMAVQRTDSGVGWDQELQLQWHAQGMILDVLLLLDPIPYIPYMLVEECCCQGVGLR